MRIYTVKECRTILFFTWEQFRISNNIEDNTDNNIHASKLIDRVFNAAFDGKKYRQSDVLTARSVNFGVSAYEDFLRSHFI